MMILYIYYLLSLILVLSCNYTQTAYMVLTIVHLFLSIVLH